MLGWSVGHLQHLIFLIITRDIGFFFSTNSATNKNKKICLMALISLLSKEEGKKNTKRHACTKRKWSFVIVDDDVDVACCRHRFRPSIHQWFTARKLKITFQAIVQNKLLITFNWKRTKSCCSEIRYDLALAYRGHNANFLWICSCPDNCNVQHIIIIIIDHRTHLAIGFEAIDDLTYFVDILSIQKIQSKHFNL